MAMEEGVYELVQLQQRMRSIIYTAAHAAKGSQGGRGHAEGQRLVRCVFRLRTPTVVQVTQRLMVAGSSSRSAAAGQSGRLDPASLSMGRNRLNGLQMARKIIR